MKSSLNLGVRSVHPNFGEKGEYLEIMNSAGIRVNTQEHLTLNLQSILKQSNWKASELV